MSDAAFTSLTNIDIQTSRHEQRKHYRPSLTLPTKIPILEAIDKDSQDAHETNRCDCRPI